MVLSPRSLSYARDALESLFRNSLEHFIQLHKWLERISRNCLRQWRRSIQGTSVAGVLREGLGRPRGRSLQTAHANLRAFRHGHPCWRKITDPLLLSDPGAELLLLDPDLYFPNRFRFEETPQKRFAADVATPKLSFPARSSQDRDWSRNSPSAPCGHWSRALARFCRSRLAGLARRQFGRHDSAAHHAYRSNRAGRLWPCDRRRAP